MQIQPEMALVATSGVRENLKWIRDNEDLQMRISMTDVFPIVGRLGLGSLALRHKSQSATRSSIFFFSFFFLSLSCAQFSFSVSLWAVDDYSPQLLISQYTCAWIRKRGNTWAHTQTRALPECRIDSTAQKQTKRMKEYIAAWFILIRTTPCRFELDAADVLPIWEQQKDLFFSPPDTIIMSCGSTCESQRDRGGGWIGEEKTQTRKQEANPIFNSPVTPNLPQPGTVSHQQGSEALTSMNMFWTNTSTLLAIWMQEEPWVPK